MAKKSIWYQWTTYVIGIPVGVIVAWILLQVVGAFNTEFAKQGYESPILNFVNFMFTIEGIASFFVLLGLVWLTVKWADKQQTGWRSR